VLREKIDYLINSLKVKNFIVYVHPFIDAYLKKGIFSEYMRWRMKMGFKFRIMPDQSLAYLQYKVLDKKHNEIDIKEEKDMNSSSSKNRAKTKNRNDEE
jgi:ribonuclease G